MSEVMSDGSISADQVQEMMLQNDEVYQFVQQHLQPVLDTFRQLASADEKEFEAKDVYLYASTAAMWKLLYELRQENAGLKRHIVELMQENAKLGNAVAEQVSVDSKIHVRLSRLEEKLEQ